MDYLGEMIALGVDSIILVICIKQYLKNRNDEEKILSAPMLDINDQLKDMVLSSPESKLASFRGIVRPLGSPLRSLNNPKVTGVVQRLCIKEHVIQRTSAGFWSDQERTIQEVFNSTPFLLKSQGGQIEVVDALSADMLDMEVISDHFEPSVPSFMDHLWGFFAGVRQRGLQSTEEMLRTGTLITAIGELAGSNEERSIHLQPPSDGKGPFYLTTMPVPILVKKISEKRRSYKWLSVVFGSIGILLVTLIVRRYLADRKRRFELEIERGRLELTRRERRCRVRNSPTTEEDRSCVVCRDNPREVILLPCGHVCLCEDCTEGINNTCPVCRTPVHTKAAAYIS